MVVVARYKGKDGLKGYKTGQTYSILFSTLHPGCAIKDYQRKGVHQGEGTLISYPTMRKFLDNWEVTK